MSSRSVKDVRQELAAEREGLTEAVEDLREEGGKLKSKLPVVIGGAVAGLIGVRAIARLLRR